MQGIGQGRGQPCRLFLEGLQQTLLHPKAGEPLQQQQSDDEEGSLENHLHALGLRISQRELAGGRRAAETMREPNNDDANGTLATSCCGPSVHSRCQINNCLVNWLLGKVDGETACQRLPRVFMLSAAIAREVC